MHGPVFAQASATMACYWQAVSDQGQAKGPECKNVNFLQDKRAGVVERALAALADMTQTAGGDFLARRFTKEAWPLMQTYLQDPLQALTRCTAGCIPRSLLFAKLIQMSGLVTQYQGTGSSPKAKSSHSWLAGADPMSYWCVGTS